MDVVIEAPVRERDFKFLPQLPPTSREHAPGWWGFPVSHLILQLACFAAHEKIVAMEGANVYTYPRMVENVLYIVAAYLVGSVPFGYLAGRIKGVDLREHGSRNIGATNAGRVLGKKWGAAVFLCDFLKGFLPLWWMRWHLGGDASCFSSAGMGCFLAVMFALVMGHTFTCFLHFKGGKGVATTAGCLFAVSLWIALPALIAWLLMMVLTRYVSLSSMVAGLAMLAAAAWEFWLHDGGLTASDGMLLGLLALIFILVVYKHRTNIRRLCAGTEPKAFSKKTD